LGWRLERLYGGDAVRELGALDDDSGRLGAAMHAERRKDALHPRADGFGRDVEARGDVSV